MNHQSILLDRDGVVNKDSTGYIKSVDEWEPLAGSMLAIAKLNAAGYRVFIITNQSGIGRGYYSLQDMHDIHKKMHETLKKEGGIIEDVFFCPHAPEEQCKCRKPEPGMLLQCESQYGVDLSQVSFVGDKLSDLQAAEAVGATPILVKTGYGCETLKSLPSDHGYGVYQNLAEYVSHLLSV